MKIVFMGTPQFAVSTLEAILNTSNEVAAVFTKVDKPKGRGKKLQGSEVKAVAIANNLPLYQPLKLRGNEEMIGILREINPDCIVVTAYGQILPKEILEMPRYGCINVHASLLPKYRGAAPIHWSIIDGETSTGVTIMHMAEGIDTGDIIMSTEIPIEIQDTTSILYEKLAHIGGELLVETLSMLENGTAPRMPQPNLESIQYAKMISKEMCEIDFTKPAFMVYNLIRGLADSPCAFTYFGNKRMKVYFAEMTDNICELPIGQIGNTLEFVCGDKRSILVTDLAIEGGKRMSGEAFTRGIR